MKKLLILSSLLVANSSFAAISFSGTAMSSGNTNVVASTSVGVLINLDSGTNWNDIAQVPAGTAFTIGSQFTINTTTFTVFGSNTATGLGSVSGVRNNFSFTGGMSASDQFALLLFPSAAQATSVSGGTALKLYRSSDWLLPANDTSGSTFNFAASGGAFTQVAGASAVPIQSFNVVPEPSTYALLAMSGLAMGGYIVRRRNRA
jgi:hypothetical protein